MHSIRSDGINFYQVTNLLVAENYLHDFIRSLGSADHPDMIQFWTTNTTSPSENVTIRDNVLNSGTGGYTQSIFMRNELVDQGRAGLPMFYRNITIAGNVIINAHLHGITLGESDGVIIRNNTLIRNAISAGDEQNYQLVTPRINVASAARNVVIERNVIPDIAGFDGQSDWTVTDNFIIQDRERLRSGFYATVFANPFAGDIRDLSSFAYLPGGPLDGAGLGAARLQD